MMRAIAACVVLVLGFVVVSRDRQDPGYRVAAVFDTAKGLVPGQQVKVAGAVVGSIADVDLVAGPKARVTMEVEDRFRPFRADASCRILPEGLISENYVECSPGSPGTAPLPDGAGGTPTVTVARTAVPVSLQDVINVFSLPTSERLQVVISQLGLATAGRGRDLNAFVRRANPSLTQARRVLSILQRQRDTLQDAVAQTDQVVDRLAERRDDVRRFVSTAARTATTAASRRDDLRAAVRDLPAMLAETRAGLRAVNRATDDGTPLLRDLRAAGPRLSRMLDEVRPFTRAATPAVRRLLPAARTARGATVVARPLATQLTRTLAEIQPFSGRLRDLLVSTRDTGGIDGLLRQTYSLANVASAYDSTSHIISLLAAVFPRCLGDTNLKGCSHRFDAPGNGTIPVNSPECGPQGGAPWQAPTSCVSLPARRRWGAAVDPGRQAARPSRPAPSAPATSAPGDGARPTAPSVKLPDLPSLLPKLVSPVAPDKASPVLEALQKLIGKERP